MCEEDLPAKLAADLDGHFERLVAAYQDRLYAFALRLSARPQDAEEIAQDAFVRAYRALARYPAEQVRALRLRAWLYQIALNVTRNRTRGRHATLVPLESLGEEGPSGRQADRGEGPADRLERLEQRDELAALVAALPPRYRTAVVLRHVAGLGYGEAAAVLGQPVGTVKANVHRGLRLLREQLERPYQEVKT